MNKRLLMFVTLLVLANGLSAMDDMNDNDFPKLEEETMTIEEQPMNNDNQEKGVMDLSDMKDKMSEEDEMNKSSEDKPMSDDSDKTEMIEQEEMELSDDEDVLDKQ